MGDNRGAPAASAAQGLTAAQTARSTHAAESTPLLHTASPTSQTQQVSYSDALAGAKRKRALQDSDITAPHPKQQIEDALGQWQQMTAESDAAVTLMQQKNARLEQDNHILRQELTEKNEHTVKLRQYLQQVRSALDNFERAMNSNETSSST